MINNEQARSIANEVSNRIFFFNSTKEKNLNASLSLYKRKKRLKN